MNKTLAFFFLLISIGSATAYYQSKKPVTTDKLEIPQLFDDSFGVFLRLDKVDENTYDLSATIELDEGAYVVSPFSKDEIYGHFDISIPKSPHFTLENELIETPPSVEEFDAILEIPVRFVRGITTYKQRVKIEEKNDFEVSGLIWFVLEPKCIPYDVGFSLAYEKGEMEIKKTSTTISKGYKQ